MQLQKLLEQQKELQQLLGNPMGTGVACVKENALALIREVVEVLDEVPSKPWHQDENPMDFECILLELVDVLMFWMNIVNEMGFTAEDLMSGHECKITSAKMRFGNVK